MKPFQFVVQSYKVVYNANPESDLFDWLVEAAFGPFLGWSAGAYYQNIYQYERVQHSLILGRPVIWRQDGAVALLGEIK